MRLADFIQRDMATILTRWEVFAATRLPAAASMAPLELRDHAQQILEAVVADLSRPQTPEQQTAKSMGLAPVAADAPETAAQTHAVLRAKSGFDIEQLASEYRALRASVLSLWIEACEPEPPELEDMIRFNEAIDQALAESIGFFSSHVTRMRNLFLGMLSHDLRSPLQTILATAQYLQHIDATDEVSKAAARLISSGAHMQKLLDDLMDFNRSRLGLGINVTPHDVDLGSVCAEELEQIRAAYPDRRVELDVSGDCSGRWDAGRLKQLVNNLVVNALRYGEHDGTVRVEVRAEDGEVVVSIKNAGPAISPDILAHIFEPLNRGHVAARHDDSGLGLGLYIANEIAKAHGGRIACTSEGTQTMFVAHLPRNGARTAASVDSDRPAR